MKMTVTEATEKNKAIEFCLKSLERDIEGYSIAAEEKSDL